MVDPLALAQTLEERLPLIGAIAWHEEGEVLPDDLLGRVAEDPLGAPVPTGDDAVARLADDGVVRGVDDGRQALGFFLERRQPGHLLDDIRKLVPKHLRLLDVARRTAVDGLRGHALAPHGSDEDDRDPRNLSLGCLQDGPGVAARQVVVQQDGQERLASQQRHRLADPGHPTDCDPSPQKGALLQLGGRLVVFDDQDSLAALLAGLQEISARPEGMLTTEMNRPSFLTASMNADGSTGLVMYTLQPSA